MEKKSSKIIHAGKLLTKDGNWSYLFLRQINDSHYLWFVEDSAGIETETKTWGATICEALRLAQKSFATDSFRTVICGFRYTLPERDEHGINALFHQMVSSYMSPNGIYFDSDLGNNCFVQNASDEALGLWKRLLAEKKL